MITQPDKLNLYLIKPSKYDDDGYVIRYWKGVLPSNTLSCLYGLTLDVKSRGVLGEHLIWNIETIDETVQRVDISKIIRSSKQKKTKTIVCLVGVQSNQFPRAYDLALDFRRAGLDVLIGGFHVSGILATLDKLSPELLELQQAGVTLVAGEVEHHWELILRDVLNNASKPIYNFLKESPDLSNVPTPQVTPNLLNYYAVQHFATLDCGRGCPFQCSFCTVINVQGRQMRFRCVDSIIQQIRENYTRYHIAYYFFTDDNFCRNKNWEAVFEKLTELREVEKIPVVFMIQVDTQSFRIPNFVEKASRAGCSQVFIGMESINEENLHAVGKKQNRVADFKNLVDAYRNAGIAVHLAYIIGFPFDDEESVRQDMIKVRELGADQASFFMLTPLPGSMDYRHFVSSKVLMDADLNNFDSFHETFSHARMKNGAWSRAYGEAWKGFYSPENMKRILKRARPEKYWGLFVNFVWYKNAIQVEGGHPMLHGFVRLKTRRERRSAYPLESRWVYFKRRVLEVGRTLVGWCKLALEMEEVWLATRHRSFLEERVLLELNRSKKHVLEWRNLNLSQLSFFYRRAALALRQSPRPRFSLPIRIPSRFQLWVQKWNVFSDSLTFTRSPMRKFWIEVIDRLKKGKWHQIPLSEVIFTSFREFVLFVRFLLAALRHVDYFAWKSGEKAS
jgi:radical SAM superfamily enzyme YgiQ (UPF0313 family)